MNNTGAMPKKSTSYFCLNLGQTAEDSDMFTIIWLRSRGLRCEGVRKKPKRTCVTEFAEDRDWGLCERLSGREVGEDRVLSSKCAM